RPPMSFPASASWLHALSVLAVACRAPLPAVPSFAGDAKTLVLSTARVRQTGHGFLNRQASALVVHGASAGSDRRPPRRSVPASGHSSSSAVQLSRNHSAVEPSI
ncbi:unnamed protein product, partial [Prorocentrum cordatum]